MRGPNMKWIFFAISALCLAFSALGVDSNVANAATTGHRRYLICMDPVVKGCRYDCGFYDGAVCTPLTNRCQTQVQPILTAGMFSRSAFGEPGPYLAMFDNYASMQCFMKFQ